jgi:hypothetical protein
MIIDGGGVPAIHAIFTGFLKNQGAIFTQDGDGTVLHLEV